MKKIGIIYGGKSIEHDVSVISGVMALNSNDNLDYEFIPIYVDRDGVFYTGELLYDIENYKDLKLKKLFKVCFLPSDNSLYKIVRGKLKKIASLSAVINCMHGERGEDGSVAGLLNLSSIPIASPEITESAISMDKEITKLVLKSMNVPVLKSVTVKDKIDIKKIERLGYPLIIKPAKAGSSIGITKAKNQIDLRSSINYSKRFSNKVIVEKCLTDFYEINCAVYRDEFNNIIVSELERPVSKNEVLSFDDKYKLGSREFPAKVDRVIKEKIISLSKKVYDRLFERGIIRIDYLVSDGKVYLNEINSVPGSLAYYLYSDTFKGFSKILTSLIKKAEVDFSKNSSLTTKYKTDLLNIKGTKGAKRL